ncbi:hypothetical protein HS088_TW21G00615 [Tripterygium wilfordii]|uniref:Uncharacterized protein n=1 Tax=Tripterygium wilfordii TaxID=458696 RepID=A0A7J7C2X6_TRIWF|nr:uncharacterized protein LOC119989753 [Tripterygium wilfordii]KAF5728468.1 hypothetical protein HS088_TW21G00615 [Tripterygium wilfordii]
MASSSPSSTLEVTVFTDTNLGTHIAVAVSPDTIVGDLKRELERTHFKCLPNLREIKVLGLMVERKSCFYHLPDSFPIKHAFLGHKRSWFVHAEVRPPKVLDGFSLFQFAGTKKGNHISDSSNVIKPLQINTEKDDKVSQTTRITRLPVVRHQTQELLKSAPFVHKKRRKKSVRTSEDCRSLTCNDRDEKTPDPAIEENCRLSASKKEVGVSRGTNSTSAAIQKQLPTKPKAKSDDNCSSIFDDDSPMVKTPARIASSPFPSEPSPSTPMIKRQKLEVGKRMLAASKNLNSLANKGRPVISSYGFKTRKLPHLNAFSVAKTLVFELGDDDD